MNIYKTLLFIMLCTACVSVWAERDLSDYGCLGEGSGGARAANSGSPVLGVARRAHYVLKGGYVAAGVDMRNKGYGTITIAGIPAKSKIARAFLYWDILNPGPSATLASGRFKGSAITGALVGSGGDPCWQSGGANYAYRADVTNLVKGNGTYALSNFASGDTDGRYPWDDPPEGQPFIKPPLAEGATLIVIYSNTKSPAMDIVVVEGSDLVTGPYSLTVDGFAASKPVTSASYTTFGADGQSGGCASGEEMYFNGNYISNSDWDGADGPNQLWDTHTHDVTGFVPAESTSATISYPGNACDCTVWVGAVFAVSAADTDGDGLWDSWEKDGYDYDEDGKVDVDLPAMGAKYNHKDVFVEIDYMVDGAHSHKPNTTAINKIVASFKAAPVLNPDGKAGINLHVDRGQSKMYKGSNAIVHQDILPGVLGGDWSAFDAIKATNFAPERESIFHYCLFAHDIAANGTSGLSRGIPGSDFIVSLGQWTNDVGSMQEQAGTFMHELGHNINLKHGGNDHVNYKPNFLSIMNYLFQTRGLRKGAKEGTFDYSRFQLPALNENDLNETIGLNGGAAINSYGTRYFCGNVGKAATKANKPIDWNCNNDKTEVSVAANINNEGGFTTLENLQDWDNLDYRGGSIGAPGAAKIELAERAEQQVPLHELTVHEDRLIHPTPPERLEPETRATKGKVTVQWVPVGLDNIKAYNIYREKPNGKRTLVKRVNSSPEKEESERMSVTLPGGKGIRYSVTAVDRNGNESEPAE